MEKFTLTKERADRLMSLKGNLRGGFFAGHFKYVKDLKGEEGIKKVEKKLAELGYPLKEKEISNVKWYPEALACLMVLVTKEVFNLTKEDIFEMGKKSPRYSFIVRLLMSHFLKPERSFKEAPRYWRENYDFGEMKTIGFNEKEKYGLISIKNFRTSKDADKYDPLICIYHEGYFLGIAQMAIPGKKVKIEHTKCLFNNQDQEEFKISWE